MTSAETAPAPAAISTRGTAERIRFAVLCSPADPCGPWLLERLRRRGLPVRLVTGEEIVYAPRIEHGLTSAGVTSVVTLRDGARLGPDLCGVVNRLTSVPTWHLATSVEAEREYAVQELHAILTSMLAGLPGVVANRAVPRGLAGPVLRPAEWLVLAGRVGLPGVGFRSTAADTEVPRVDAEVLVVGDRVLPRAPYVGMPAYVERGGRALAREAGTGILGLGLRIGEDGWRLATADPLPDLRGWGEPGVDAVLRLLRPAEVTA